MIVLKFGGSSLATPDKIRCCAEIVKSALSKKPVVVVSAHGKTTDMLIKCAKRALEGEVDAGDFRSYHFSLIDSLGIDATRLGNLVFHPEAICQGIRLVGELTARTLDLVMSFGERISSRIFAAVLCNMGVPAEAVNSFDIGFITDSNFGNASPLEGIEEEIARNIESMDRIPVITGFLGKNSKDKITTIGRSGSDFTASFIGAAIKAEEVQIWKDVDGVLTANPTLDPRAQKLPKLSFNEASELAYYGAEVLHPATLIPAIRKNIPVRVANTVKPDEPGTIIYPHSVLTNRIAKSVVYKRGVGLLNIVSLRLLPVTSLLSAVLEVLTKQNIRPHMVVTSESSISIVTDSDYSEKDISEVKKQLSQHAEITYEHNSAIVCVIGEELKENSESLGMIFSAISKENVQPLLVSQSASKLNISLIVKNTEIEKTVKAVHSLIINS
ncbi:MAG: aspartate kinase [Planctomycetota bacterium]